MEQIRNALNTSREPFRSRVYLASPTMHEDEQRYIEEAFRTNWVSTIGANLDRMEEMLSELIGRPYTVALASGTASLHMAVRAAAVKLYGEPGPSRLSLEGKRVFCSDLTFAASVNPVIYEGGEPVFIDSEYETWNMDPEALERAFRRYPDVKLVVMVHLYGTPAKIDRIRAICDAHSALLIEDAAESLGALYRGRQTGAFGDIGVISFNGNKIITGSCGGALLCDDEQIMRRVRKWSTQSREPVAWYQHRELGFNYRLSNIIAGIIRGQLPWLEDHMARKTALYARYEAGMQGLPVRMNPCERDIAKPNHWLSCILIDREAMCPQTRDAKQAVYTHRPGKSCPTELLSAVASLNAEGRPIWKPMHMQPIYEDYPFVSAEDGLDVGADLFARGLCLPSDIKMTAWQQDQIIDVIRDCFV